MNVLCNERIKNMQQSLRLLELQQGGAAF